MGQDRREEILAQLFAVLGDIDGAETVVRNRAEFTTDLRPVICQLDGNETVTTRQNRSGRDAAQVTTSMVRLEPQIFVLLKSQKPKNLSVGQDLNAFRSAILKAVGTDATLLSLVTANGSIEYDGCQTDLQTGSTVEGEMQLNIRFLYPLNIKEL